MMELKDKKHKSMLEHEDVTMRGCREYKRKYGHHFTKELCEFAVNMMKNRDRTNHRYSLKDVKRIWKENNLPDINKANWHDVTFVMNMGYADYYGKLYTEDREVAIYAYLTLSDIDGYEGIAFSRWLMDCKRKHVVIDWYHFIDEDNDDDYDDDDITII